MNLTNYTQYQFKPLTNRFKLLKLFIAISFIAVVYKAAEFKTTLELEKKIKDGESYCLMIKSSKQECYVFYKVNDVKKR